VLVGSGRFEARAGVGCERAARNEPLRETASGRRVPAEGRCGEAGSRSAPEPVAQELEVDGFDFLGAGQFGEAGEVDEVALIRP
jgi:hypothetical protein